MPLRVTIANREEGEILRRLGQLYLHEMCKCTHQELQDDGTFEFSRLEDHLADETKFPYIVRLRDRVAGFALVRTRDTSDDKTFYEISDLFVIETYRRFGVGEEVARVIFDRHPGLWRITARNSAELASNFWKKVVKRYAPKAVREFASHDVDATILEFTSPPPVTSHQLESVLTRPILKVSVKGTG